MHLVISWKDPIFLFYKEIHKWIKISKMYGLFLGNGFFKIHGVICFLLKWNPVSERWWGFRGKALYWYNQNIALVKTLKNGTFESHTEAFSLQRLHEVTCLYSLQLLMSMHLPSWVELYSIDLNRSQPVNTVSFIHTNGKGIPVHRFCWPSPISTYFIQPQLDVNEVFYSHTLGKTPYL